MRNYRERARQLVASSAVSALVVAGAVVAGVALAASASADPAPIGDGTASTVTADALPTAQINGVVWSQAVVGNTVYAAGNFTQARPAGVAVGGAGSVARGNLMSYNLTTGALTSFAPSLNAQAKVVTASPDGSRIYVGGSFTTANGLNRYRLAAYSTATGQLISTFAPILDATVNAITATNTTVYVGGAFGSANNVARTRLAAFSASNGALLGWAPTANAEVQALVLTPNGSKVIAGGSFTSVNGSTSAYGLAALDSSTGALLPWAANSVVRDAGTAAAILNLSTDGTAIYGSGYVFGAGGNLEGSFSADPETGAINWVEDCHGDTYSTFAANGALYNVGHAHYCGNVGGYPQTAPDWTFHRALQFSASATGTLLHNSESVGSYADFGGQPSPTLDNWFPDLDAGTFTGQSQAAWSVSGNSQYVVLGGEFPRVNGVAQQGLVRFAVPSLAPNKQGPMVSGANFKASLLGFSNTSVRVAWPANWDRDDQTLTYKVVRNGDTNHPIYTTTATAQFWHLPGMGIYDKGLTPGATYQYRVSASDPDGNLVWGDTVSITVPTVNPGPYVQRILDDGASNYWRLDETSGTTANDWAGFNNLVQGTGVTAGAAGALLNDTDTAGNFSGATTASAGTVSDAPGPNVFSVEAWFKTNSTTGGKIVGFGNAQSGLSTSYDRNIYMDNTGHVIFGVYNGATYTVTSTGTYNNNAWHHVVGTLSDGGVVLYLDGKKIGVNQGTTVGQTYSGFWRVGGDNLGSWPGTHTSNYFKGAIDEVAVYPTALTLPQVQSHYLDSGRTLTVAARPSDTYGAGVYQDSPDLYWRLDDTTGTTAADASANGVPGGYFGGVTKGVTSNVSGSTGTAVTFNGSTGTIGSSQSYVNPRIYSEELWFTTTTTRGGKLIGFGNRQSGNSTSHDRDVYMLNTGQLVFGVNATPVTLTTAAAYNDGNWHHLVATESGAGMRLYVDDQLVGSNTTTTAQNYTGYWRVGGDAGVTSTSAYLAGTIDEAAVYSIALSPAQVHAHYRASAAATNARPVAAFTPSCTNLACTFDGSASADADGSIASYSWDFGDGSTGTVAATSHTYTAAGTYAVVLTVTDDLGATGSVTHTVTVAPPPNVVADRGVHVVSVVPECDVQRQWVFGSGRLDRQLRLGLRRQHDRHRRHAVAHLRRRRHLPGDSHRYRQPGGDELGHAGAHRCREPGSGGGVHADVHEPRLLVRRQRICGCGRVDCQLCLGLRRRGNQHRSDDVTHLHRRAAPSP